MGELKSKILFVCVFVLLFGAAPVALGDWDVGDGHKMHYPQLPKPGGWDVALWSEGSVWLADDWQCSETGPVEDIHFWVSWEDDMVSTIGGFTVRIWSDNPSGEQGYSEPNELLWERDFDAGEFTVRDMPDDLQGWFDPYSGSFSPDDHIMWQQINIVDINDPWIQKEGKIYWLMIDMWGAPYCGWKESGSPHFRDNGVYSDGLKWVKLVDPMSQESLDLAFVITGDVKHKNLKWSQPPIEIDPNADIPTYCGWDEPSYTVDPDFDWLIVADDFRCLGTMPVTSIHWWGSHVGWEEPGIEPPDLPSAWRIGFWSNVSATQRCDFLYGAATGQPQGNAPSDLYKIDPTTGAATLIGPIGFNGVTGLSFAPDGTLYASANGDNLYADGFGHAILLTIDTTTGAGTFVGEISNNDPTTDPNGAGRMPDISFDLGGVLYGYADQCNAGDSLWTINTGTGAGTLIGPTGYWGGGNGLDFAPGGTLYATPYDNQSLVIINPATGAGSDVAGTVGNVPDRINALEFCESTGVLYGSWNDSMSGNRFLVTLDLTTGLPTVIGQTVQGLDAITFNTFSHPEELLWQIEVPEDRVDVEEVGSDEYPEIPYYDVCYQYYLNLERDEWFWQNKYETQDHIYWLSIAAIYDPDMEDPQYLWGWKTRPWSWMDDGVRFWVDENPVPGMVLDPGLNMIEPIIEPVFGESFDLAFELDTDPCYVKHEQPFTGIRDWPHYEDQNSMAMRETRSKWWQGPDPVGWDVAFEYMGGPRLELADDWQCDETGTIDDIHFWLSWENDFNGDINAVTVKIYSNDPCGPGNFSEPNELKWSRRFSIGQFSWSWYDSGAQGWFDPYTGDWEDPDHIEYYYLSIDDINDPFIQQQGDIYWLSIELEVDRNGGWAGWKTTTSPWQDVAVWRAPGASWQMLEEPIMGASLELAFELTTSELVIDRLVADDWPCDGNEPVSAAVWWGSYIGYRYAACDIDGPWMDLPVPPDYFLLNIWTDVPADSTDPTSYSHPNDIIWEYNAYDYDEVLVGYDKHPEDPDPDGEGREPVFRYSVRLPKKDWFFQDEPNNVYWFGVVAVYEESLPNYDWGWTNHKHVYNDDAVAGVWDEENGEWVWEELYDQTEVNSVDMSFILFNSCPCKGDVSDTTGFGPPDGVVDIGDLNYTLMAMFAVYPAGDPLGLYDIGLPAGMECGDVSDTTGFGPPDGKIDIGDLNYVLMAMFAVYPAGDPTGLYQIPCL